MRLWIAIAVVAACVLTSAAPSVAGSADTGFVVAKDLQTKRVTLHTGVVLQVTAATRLLSKTGTRITIGGLKVTEASDGVVVADPDALVRYEGRMRGGVVDARVIRVVGLIPQ